MIGTYTKDDVVWTQPGARGDYGGYGAPIVSTIKARVKNEVKIVRNLTGEQVTSSTTVKTKIAINPTKDKLTIDGRDRSIINVVTIKKFRVVKFYLVFLA